MELILRDDIERLGRRGEIVNVAAGYGRNYLLPRGLAIPVSEANKAMIAKERKGWEARMAKEKEEYEALAGRIAELRFVAPRKVGENEMLYGSVTSSKEFDHARPPGWVLRATPGRAAAPASSGGGAGARQPVGPTDPGPPGPFRQLVRLPAVGRAPTRVGPTLEGGRDRIL